MVIATEIYYRIEREIQRRKLCPVVTATQQFPRDCLPSLVPPSPLIFLPISSDSRMSLFSLLLLGVIFVMILHNRILPVGDILLFSVLQYTFMGGPLRGPSD